MAHYKCYGEIKSQGAILRQALDDFTAVSQTLKRFIEEIQPTDIYFIGCGSPYYLGDSSALTWQTLLGVRARALPSAELFQYSNAYTLPSSSSPFLIAVSRSGSTSETLWAVQQFEAQYPGRTLLITCTEDSPIGERATHSIVMPYAREDTMPQTKSFSAMYLAAQALGAIVSDNSELLELIDEVPVEVARIIVEHEAIAAEIGQNEHIDHAFYMGGGPLYGIAREGSLKMTEMTMTTCSAYPFMEARHGPQAILTPNTLMIGLLSKSATLQEAQVIKEFVETAAPLSVTLTGEQQQTSPMSQFHIPLSPSWPDHILGLGYLPILHLIAYYYAVQKGENPDLSRNVSFYVDLSKDNED